VSKPNDKYLPAEVKVKLAVPPEVVKSNIKTNLENIPSWFDRLFHPNGYEAIILSAGASLEKYVEELNLKERMQQPNRDFLVFCVKHALPRLLKMGIIPDFCVILDGRPFEEDSTHGVNRKELFESIPGSTIFFVASMSNPGYAKHLKENGGRVLGWHTDVGGLDEFRVKEPVISGGTSSGTRAISLAHAMGMRKITLVGFDSCIIEGVNDPKDPSKIIPFELPLKAPQFNEEQRELLGKLTKSYNEEGLKFGATLMRSFKTTGELVAQAQDFEKLFSAGHYDLDFQVYDDGLVSHMFHNMNNRMVRAYDFLGYLKEAAPRNDPEK
jgi:hypothetical protein